MGQRGVIGLIDKGTFLPLDLGVKIDLSGVCMGSDGLGFIVGNKGTVLRSLDGGVNWRHMLMTGEDHK